MVRVVLLGLPGSGKSTQAAMISGYYSVTVVSPGALLRKAVAEGSEIGHQAQQYLERGELVPNHLVDLLVYGRLRQPDCHKGFILDGFPRTLEQADSLDIFLRQNRYSLSEVIYLDAPDSVIMARLNARRVCQSCGAIYNLSYNKPSQGDICYACHTPLGYVAPDVLQCEGCGTPFVLRDDDKPDVAKRRLQVQRKALELVKGHSRNRGLLAIIDAARPPQEVFRDITAILGRKQRRAGGNR